MDKFGETVTGVIASVITLAIIALVISQHATSVGVLTSFFQGLTGLLGVAISPVTGTTSQFANTGLQSSGLFQSGGGYGVNSGGVNLGGVNLGGLGGLVNTVGSFGNAGGIPSVAGDLSNYATSASDYTVAPGFSLGG